jgi:hypothetical protein
MPEILRDPVWQFIGAVFAILAFAFGFFLYWKQRQRKELSYEFFYRAPLVSVEKAVERRVKILLDDKPVQNVYLVAVRILNSGNLPIVSADYELPVSLCFSENAQVISAVGVLETKPKSLPAPVGFAKTKVVLAPILLNSGDSIMLIMLVNQFDGQIGVYGHIVGVKDIRELERESWEPFAKFVIYQSFGNWFFVLGTLLSTLLLSSVLAIPDHSRFVQVAMGIATMVITIVTVILLIVYRAVGNRIGLKTR